MGEEPTKKDLLKLYSDRVKDRQKAQTRRRRKGESTPETMSDMLSEYFKRDPEATQRIQQSKALMAWAKIVGPSAAQVSRALRIRGSQMVVQVSDPMWAQQLLLLKNQLLQKYKRHFPRLYLRDIFFVTRSS